MSVRKKIVIVGAGPGGLSAAMLLAHRGYEVHVYEKESVVGGRNRALHIDGFTFDMGPTFFMMPFVLEEIFRKTGRDLHDYVDLRSVDPLYRLRFADMQDFYPTCDREKMIAHIEDLFPGDGEGYRRFLDQERKKFDVLYPCLVRSYLNIWDYLHPSFFKLIPRLDAHTSVYNVLSRYFRDERLRIAMTFQAKYLGMSPWECLGTFSILSFIEHEWGIHHPIGGLNQLSAAMARAAEEEGAHIHLDAPVREVCVQESVATGIVLESGERIDADAVVINADFAHAMQSLVSERHRTKYTDAKLAQKKYSCSTFMLYLGLDTQYDIPHHNIFFANDYRANVHDIVQHGRLSDDFSFYIQNPCVTDTTLAPEGCSTLYVLVPVPNMEASVHWHQEENPFREKVLNAIEQRTELKDLRSHIVTERMVTPADWCSEGVYRGATFNLAHNFGQMLYLRPRNKFEEFDNCYLVGGGTHPGSGLPTIIESGRICADLVAQRI